MAPRPKATVADFPDVAAQLHPTMNGGVRAEQIAIGSTKKYWWICYKGPDHVWHASPNGRVKVKSERGRTKYNIRGCRACAGLQASVTNSVATLFPELASQWHPSKNGDITPDKVVAHSNKKYWWKCPKGLDHEWEAQPNNRIMGGTGCPFCQNRKVSVTNCLETVNPKLAREWHPERNGALTPRDVLAGTSSRYWWKCPKGPDHEWRQSPNQRISKNADCPFCRGFRVSVTNSLANRYPEISKLWHPTRNGAVKPRDVTFGTHEKYWWKCPKGPDHEWFRSPNDMVNQLAATCPFCANIYVSVTNSLATRFPKMAAEFHPTKNFNHRTRQILTADDVLGGSKMEAWWRCSKNPEHVWPASIVSRTWNGNGCPWCRITPRSRAEILIAFELAYVLGFDPTKHKLRVGKRVIDVDTYLPKLSLVVEYDGSYTHRDKEENDGRKTQLLRKHGWIVIRLREEPLECLTEHDIVVPVTRYRDEKAIKITANLALQQIVSITLARVPNLRQYIRRKTCANRKAAEEYIDELQEASQKRTAGSKAACCNGRKSTS